MAKLVDPCIKAEALAMLGMNETQVTTAQAVGVSQQAVSLLANQTKAKAIIEHIQAGYILEAAKIAVNNQLYKIRRANKILRDPDKYPSESLHEYKTLLDLADKAEYRLGQMIGMTPAHAPSYVMNVLLASGQADEGLQELKSVQAFLSWKRGEDIQEAEVIELDDTSEPEGESI